MPDLRREPLAFAAFAAVLIVTAPARAQETGTVVVEPPAIVQAPVATPPAAARPAIARTPEQAAIHDLREQAREEMAALLESLAPLPDGPARDALERKLVEMKKQHRVAMLRLRAGFARGRGDLAAVRTFEAAIEHLLHPPVVPATETVVRERPSQPAGGAR